MKLQIICEQNITLSDLYSEDELNDESEMMYSYIDEDDFTRSFVVHSMTPEEAKKYTTGHGDISVFDAYKQFANKDQKKLVNYKAKHWDNNRIILVINNTVLDGNHHLIAGILANKPIKYINLSEF